jgi:choline kinase
MSSLNIKTAVILCAGRGTRLGTLTNNSPKCLLNVCDKSILERAITQFVEFGITRIVLVVGFQSEKVIEKVKGLVEDLKIVYNPNFASTNTLVSLWCAREYLEEGFWLLNGDVLFDPQAFSRFTTKFSEIGVLPGKCGEEEVKVKIDDNGHVNSLSKTVANALGEFIGLAYFDPEFSKALITCLENWQSKKEVDTQYFEAAVEDAMLQVPLRIADLSGLNCIEIDTPEDYKRAEELWGCRK